MLCMYQCHHTKEDCEIYVHIASDEGQNYFLSEKLSTIPILLSLKISIKLVYKENTIIEQTYLMRC